MAKQINCTCGYVVRGENDEELLRNAWQHVRSEHADMADQFTDEQLLGMAQES